MRLAVLAGMGGVLALHRLPVVPSSITLLSLAFGGELLAFLAWGLRGRSRLIVAALAVAVLAFTLTGARATLRLDARLAADWEGRDLVVEGYVASLPQPVERGVRFMFEVQSVEPHAARLSDPVLLAWYNGLSRQEFRDAPPVRAGERWRFTVRLKRPHGNANPHGFDFEAWLIEEDVRASGAIQPRAGVARIDDLAMRPGAWIERARDRLRERL
ncbi:MAG: ComEC/Rec2 family competence protein, partial [Burkholderiales bacterium]